MKKSFCLLSVLMASSAWVSGQDAATVEALRNELRDLRQRTQQLEEKLQRLSVGTNATALPPDAANSAAPTGWSPTAPMPLFRGRTVI
jgi:hypothetical protein